LKPEADEPRENTIILLVNKVLMARTVLRTVMLFYLARITRNAGCCLGASGTYCE